MIFVYNILNGLDLLYLVLFGGGKIFGIGSRIGEESFLVQLLNYLKALCHRHLVFLAEDVLEL